MFADQIALVVAEDGEGGLVGAQDRPGHALDHQDHVERLVEDIAQLLLRALQSQLALAVFRQVARLAQGPRHRRRQPVEIVLGQKIGRAFPHRLKCQRGHGVGIVGNQDEGGDRIFSPKQPEEIGSRRGRRKRRQVGAENEVAGGAARFELFEEIAALLDPYPIAVEIGLLEPVDQRRRLVLALPDHDQFQKVAAFHAKRRGLNLLRPANFRPPRSVLRAGAV